MIIISAELNTTQADSCMCQLPSSFLKTGRTHHWLRWTCASPISDLWGSRGSLNFYPPLIWSLKGCYNNIFHVEIVAAGIMSKKSTFHLLKIPQPRETNRKRRRTKTKADKRRPARIPRILPLSTILKIEELSKKEISDPRVLSQIWMKRIRFSMSPVKDIKDFNFNMSWQGNGKYLPFNFCRKYHWYEWEQTPWQKI